MLSSIDHINGPLYYYIKTECPRPCGSSKFTLTNVEREMWWDAVVINTTPQPNNVCLALQMSRGKGAPL